MSAPATTMTAAEWIERAALLLERVKGAAYACAPPIFAQQIGELLRDKPALPRELQHEVHQAMRETPPCR